MICLDISYKGLVKLATDSGAIKWAQAELVYESDTFKYRGLASEPLHEMDPFSKDRGQIIGAYCVAKTADGDFLSTMMSMDEIKEVQNTSKAKNGPWKKFFGEMAKKSVLKRAQKQWPKGTDNRLENAIHVINQHEGLEGKELNPDDYRLTGDLVEPFFDAFFNEKPLLMEEVANRCTDTQWVDLQNTFSRETKEVTKKKAKALELLRQGSALWTDIKAEYKELMQQDDDFGMLQIYGDLSVYWQSRLSDEIEGFETPPEVVNK
tara:strand:- start:1 stop:792 length:792 start_codon:yes stop_codon:yes gene_type:complete